jgi:hypothetical protein
MFEQMTKDYFFFFFLFFFFLINTHRKIDSFANQNIGKKEMEFMISIDWLENFLFTILSSKN